VRGTIGDSLFILARRGRILVRRRRAGLRSLLRLRCLNSIGRRSCRRRLHGLRKSTQPAQHEKRCNHDYRSRLCSHHSLSSRSEKHCISMINSQRRNLRVRSRTVKIFQRDANGSFRRGENRTLTDLGCRLCSPAGLPPGSPDGGVWAYVCIARLHAAYANSIRTISG